MIPLRGLSIRSRLALLVIVVAVPLLLLSIAIVWRLTDREQEAQRDAIMYSSRAILSAVDAQLGKYVAVGQSLAAYLSANTDDPVAFCTEAKHALAGLTGAWVVLADRLGQQLANTRMPGCSQNAPKILVKPEMLTALKHMAETKQVQVSGVHLSPNGQIPVIAVGIPVFRTDESHYFVAILVDTTVFFDLLNSQRMPEGWAGGIVDRSGNFITRSRNHERWVGQPAPENWRLATNKEGFFELSTVDGDVVNGANVISPLSGWALGVAIQKDVFEGPIRQTMLAAILVSGAVTALSVLLAIWAARKITKPIETLAKGAETLKRGEPVCFLPTGVPEVDHALNSFGAASETLLRHEMALSESETRLRTIVESALDGIITSDENGVIQSINPAASQLFGYEPQEVIGQSISMLMPEPDRSQNKRYLTDYLSVGDRKTLGNSREVEALRKDGSIFPIELAVSEATHKGSRLFIAFISNITERYEAEQHRQLLLGELSHRVKNTLAVVQSIAIHTAKDTKDPKTFSDAFSARIRALAISHDELTNTEWSGADLESLIKNHLAAFMGEESARLELNGPPIMLTRDKVTPLGMVMHELATNAAKYGAWSTSNGFVKVDWHLSTNNHGQILTFNWTERGGPPPVTSIHKGFGTKLISASVNVIERRFESDGLVCTFSLVLPPRTDDKPQQITASA